MFRVQPAIHKGFEIFALVFPRKFDRFDRHSRYAEGYDIAVRICRPEVSGSVGAGRVFKLTQQTTFRDFGSARRAAVRHGTEIIDGEVTGCSVSDL